MNRLVKISALNYEKLEKNETSSVVATVLFMQQPKEPEPVFSSDEFFFLFNSSIPERVRPMITDYRDIASMVYYICVVVAQNK